MLIDYFYYQNENNVKYMNILRYVFCLIEMLMKFVPKHTL